MHLKKVILIFLIMLFITSYYCIDRNKKSQKKNKLYTEFTYTPVAGLGYEEGITRRDPSDVIKVDSVLYVWYTKTHLGPSGYNATIWYAISTDGNNWIEKSEALSRGGKGAWDERSVFTPNILVANELYYLFYTAVPEPFNERRKTAIGIAIAPSPDGPWEKYRSNPILTTGKSGEWLRETETKAKFKGDWDSHRVDDACLIVKGGKYWLYYKGRQMGLSPGETKWGVAIAEKPEGPYIKSELNPLTNSGHEVLVWPDRKGVAGLITWIGPEKNTIQFAPDGLNFSIQSSVKNPPHAPGAYRPDAFIDKKSGEGISWGISMVNDKKYPYLIRFDCDLSIKKL